MFVDKLKLLEEQKRQQLEKEKAADEEAKAHHEDDDDVEMSPSEGSFDSESAIENNDQEIEENDYDEDSVDET